VSMWADDQDQNELPPHLRDDAPEASCGRCGRKTWDPDQFGQEDRMTQPDGSPCGGRFSDPKGGREVNRDR
jgi:hypothetical protein